MNATTNHKAAVEEKWSRQFEDELLGMLINWFHHRRRQHVADESPTPVTEVELIQERDSWIREMESIDRF